MMDGLISVLVFLCIYHFIVFLKMVIKLFIMEMNKNGAAKK